MIEVEYLSNKQSHPETDLRHHQAKDELASGSAVSLCYKNTNASKDFDTRDKQAHRFKRALQEIRYSLKPFLRSKWHWTVVCGVVLEVRYMSSIWEFGLL